MTMTESDLEQPSGESLAWLRSRPENIKALVRRFPPMCIVEAVPERDLVVPARGRRAHVVSYHEDGTVSVFHTDAATSGQEEFKAQCQADWLKVVEYTQPWTVEVVAAIFATSEQKS